MGRKLYVGNLPFQATDADLQALFSQAGQCESATVVTDRYTGRSRGFGFVEMSSSAEAAQAIEQFNGASFMGRNITVSEAREQSKGGAGRPSARSGRGGSGRR
ncbi:MAG: RNA-binding protein [Candidatus Binatia bacterium]|nr:MAG: RNA-binding protein [Candidatus Binatia bacterium]